MVLKLNFEWCSDFYILTVGRREFMWAKGYDVPAGQKVVRHGRGWSQAAWGFRHRWALFIINNHGKDCDEPRFFEFDRLLCALRIGCFQFSWRKHFPGSNIPEGERYAVYCDQYRTVRMLHVFGREWTIFTPHLKPWTVREDTCEGDDMDDADDMSAGYWDEIDINGVDVPVFHAPVEPAGKA